MFLPRPISLAVMTGVYYYKPNANQRPVDFIIYHKRDYCYAITYHNNELTAREL